MATGELRDRVRERLASCEQELARVMHGATDTSEDPMCGCSPPAEAADVEIRRERLARAVADFDAGTIATTHGFCQEVLAELGTEGDLDPETVFVEDVSDLLEEALDDLYVRKSGRRTSPPVSRTEAIQIARAAVVNPMADLEPRDAKRRQRRGDAPQPGEPGPAGARTAQATAGRHDLRRPADAARRTPSTAPTRLPRASGCARGSDVVLVDEFQDTDPIQWQILHRAFDVGE